MCMCRSSTHRSSSSSRRTAFSRDSLSPVVSYLEGQDMLEDRGPKPAEDGWRASSWTCLPVCVLFDVQKIVGHGLECELV